MVTLSTILPPNVTPDMLHPEFWLARSADPTAVWLTADQIAAFNARVHTVIDIPPVLDLPDTLPAEQVTAAMRRYLPARRLYTAEGQPLDPTAFETVLANGVAELADPVPVEFALAVQRTDVRAFPTAGALTSVPFAYQTDRLQETTIDVGWPVAILAQSVDQQWVFCLTPHYWGWVRTAHLARGSRQDIADFVNMEPFAVTVANRGLIALGADGGLTPQMGTRLPVHPGHDDLWLAAVPVRAEDGTLRLTSGFMAANGGDFVSGYLPLTLCTLFMQAFKLLGEHYTWGGSRLGIFGRDCSRTVRDVYATTGLLLPRNGDQQEQVGYAVITFPADMPAGARQTALVEHVSPGAILTMPGHVMLYLGHVDGVPYALHDTDASPYHGVIVSDLSLGTEKTLLMRLTCAVSVIEP